MHRQVQCEARGLEACPQYWNNIPTKKKFTQFRVNFFLCRDDPTRTDDPYVPNVVRYQLRYIPIP